jgi:hypothetical protein
LKLLLPLLQALLISFCFGTPIPFVIQSPWYGHFILQLASKHCSHDSFLRSWFLSFTLHLHLDILAHIVRTGFHIPSFDTNTSKAQTHHGRWLTIIRQQKATSKSSQRLINSIQFFIAVAFTSKTWQDKQKVQKLDLRPWSWLLSEDDASVQCFSDSHIADGDNPSSTLVRCRFFWRISSVLAFAVMLLSTVLTFICFLLPWYLSKSGTTNRVHTILSRLLYLDVLTES